MHLLILTQKMDRTDGVLGFMHHWVAKLAARVDFISVICLQRGIVNLPENVQVFSLRKEERAIRWRYILWLGRHLWRLRVDYDAVWIHMNPEYVVLAGWWWKLSGKKIFFWYNHQQGGLRVWLAARLADKVFYTSPQAYMRRFTHAVPMPVGVDAEQFVGTTIAPPARTVIYVGRLSPVKNAEILLTALIRLHNQGEKFKFTLVGEIDVKPREFSQKIKQLLATLARVGCLQLLGKVPNNRLPEILARQELLVNLTPPGSFDKVQIEAMASGTLVLTANTALQEILPPEFLLTEITVAQVVEKIKKIWELTPADKEKIRHNNRQYAATKHSLDKMLTTLVRFFS